ncbi:MAG: GxxExxY protein [Limisphaerales bacterium]
MNTDETQILPGTKDYSLQPITQQIIGAAFEVHNVLGYGFLERVYQRAMQMELQSRGVKVELEPKIQVQFKGVIVGDYAADLLVEDKIVVELKTDPAYQSVQEAQLLNELRGTGMKLGYLINFGRERVEYKRMVF